MTKMLDDNQLKVGQYPSGDLHYELHYPGVSGNPEAIQIGMMHVRASDDLRISYDFDRDGWKIEQAGVFSWPEGEEPDSDWQEVAFVRAWARDIREDARYKKLNKLLIESLDHVTNPDLVRRISNAAR